MAPVPVGGPQGWGCPDTEEPSQGEPVSVVEAGQARACSGRAWPVVRMVPTHGLGLKMVVAIASIGVLEGGGGGVSEIFRWVER